MPENNEQPIEELSLAAPEGGLAADPLANLTPEKREELRLRIAAIRQSQGQTVSGAEDPDVKERDSRKGPTNAGADVDWNEYTLEYSVAHLYPRAEFRETPEGPKWVAMVEEFMSTTKSPRQYGKKVNRPGGRPNIDMEPLNVAEFLNDEVNSREDWKLLSILPGMSGDVNVILHRRVPAILPDPVPIKKVTEAEAPREQELQDVEDAAQQFAKEEGLTATPEA